MTTKIEATAPRLEGWLSAVEVAPILGISRQSVARMMNDGVFKTLRTVGDRPLFIVREEEVDALRALREQYGSWPKAAIVLHLLPDREVGANKINMEATA